MYFVERGRVDILAPGGGKGASGGKKNKWHVAFSLMPGGMFGGPLSELHGCPPDHKAVSGTPGQGLTLICFSAQLYQ